MIQYLKNTFINLNASKHQYDLLNFLFITLHVNFGTVRLARILVWRKSSGCKCYGFLHLDCHALSFNKLMSNK